MDIVNLKINSERRHPLIKPKNNFSFLIPSIADFLFLAIFLHISLNVGKSLLGDGDTGYHIRAGEYILKTFSIPRHDMFSFISPPISWTAHEWLSEVIMAVIHKSFGLTGIVVFFAFLISLASYLLFRIINSDNNNIIIALFVVLLATITSQIHWLARPHIFSLFLMIVWYYILDLHHYKNRNYLYLLPIIMIVWANLHGGFMGGFMLLGMYLFGDFTGYIFHKNEEKDAYLNRLKVLALTTVACIAAAVINPYGYHILLFPFKLTSSKEIMDSVSEFMSPNFHENYVKSFEIFLLLLLAALGVSKFKLNVIETLLILLFTYMSLYSARYIPLFAIITAPILARQLQSIEEQSTGRFAAFIKKRATNIAAIDAAATGYFWPVVAIIVAMSSVAMGKVDYKFDEKIKPMAAIEFLKKEKLSGNMFNNDEFGDCLIYSAYPMYKVFFDGRSDMYGVDRLKEYRKIISFDQGWENILAKYRITWIFYDADSALSRFLLIHNDWKLIYADKVANIFVKNIPEYHYLIEKYPSVKPVVKDDKDKTAK
jgi:hypothetical protein